jgi:putative ABC transport system ATP-binding protein
MTVTLDHVTRSVDGIPTIRDVSLTLERGTLSVLLGPTLAGKTSIMRLLAGLDKPTSGRVLLADTDLSGLDAVRLTKLRRARMGFVFQAYNLLPALNAYDNVALPLRLAGTKPQRAEVRDILGRVGLDGLGRRRPAELSGGQQQRVAVARALVSKPEVLFADEPTGALDTTTSRQILGLLRDASESAGQTVVMVTHDPSAAAYADVVVFLEDGVIAGSLKGANAGEIAATMSELEG